MMVSFVAMIVSGRLFFAFNIFGGKLLSIGYDEPDDDV